MVTMQAGPDEHTTWWRSTDDDRFLRWSADRASTSDRHLAPVLRIGRSAEHHLVAETFRPAGDPLPQALDRLGTPSTGVAVTLTVPLVELARAAVAGAVLLGDAGVEDVLVDDAGAVVLCDRPDGARPITPDTHRPPRLDGVAALLLATRTVWERVDPREPVRPEVDAAIRSARAGGLDELDRLVECVRAAAPPRPVRWEPSPHAWAFPVVGSECPGAGAGAGSAFGTGGSVDNEAGSRVAEVLAALRSAVEQGVPIAGRRVPARQVLVGAVVTAGVAAAGWFGLGH